MATATVPKVLPRKGKVTISNDKKSGFTLTELLVVLSIMALIAALIVVAAKGARKKADYEAAKAGVQFICSQIDAYKNKRGELPPNLNPLRTPPDNTAEDDVTTEKEIYYSLSQWGFTVPPERQIDPWGHPYVVVLQRDYGKTFNVTAPFDRTDSATTPYDHYPYGPDYAPSSFFSDPTGLYRDPAERDHLHKYLSDKVSALSDVYKLTPLTVQQSTDATHWGKAIHETDDRTKFHNDQNDGYQVFSAGPDGKAYCDDNATEPNRDAYLDLNKDNVSNWTD